MQSGTDAPTRDVIEELVRKAQEGDASSFAALYECFYDRVFRYVSFKTGDTIESEDITEDVFLRMLESISSFKWRGYPFSSWLFRIAHNLVVDHFRKKARRKASPLDHATGISAAAHDVDSYLDVKQSVREVYQAMGGLTKLQREAVSLRFAAGLSVGETARAMGKKENAVKALQHAAIKKLRALLGERCDASQDHAVPEWSR